MPEEDIKKKMEQIKNASEKKLSSFRIIEHMTDEDAISTPTCEFTDEEIESVITKALNLIKFITPSLDVTTAIPKIVNYYKTICHAEAVGLTPNKSALCKAMLGNKFNPHTLGLYNSLAFIKPPEGGTAGMLYAYRYWLFSSADKQPVTWSNEHESKEIRMLYKFYLYLKACPAVKKIDSDCVNPDIGADAWGFTCADKETYGWLCDYNGAHSCQCCACNKDTCGTADGSNTRYEETGSKQEQPGCTMECLKNNKICPANQTNGLEMAKKCCKESDKLPDYVRKYTTEWCK
jgi:hypothetical protein